MDLFSTCMGDLLVTTGNEYLTNLLTSQNVARGHFIVGDYAKIETHVRPDQKLFDFFGILHIGAPQESSHELGLA